MFNFNNIQTVWFIPESAGAFSAFCFIQTSPTLQREEGLKHFLWCLVITAGIWVGVPTFSFFLNKITGFLSCNREQVETKQRTKVKKGGKTVM